MIEPGLHPNWRDLDATAWRWKRFRPVELSCRCPTDYHFCQGEYFHDPDFLDRLEHLRDLAGRPLVVNSGRRCPLRNARVKGAAFSQHKVGIACDIALTGHDPVKLARAAATAGFKGLGFGKTFLHVDARVRPPGWPRNRAWPVPIAFHYPGAAEGWTERFGFDPVHQFNTKGNLDG